MRLLVLTVVLEVKVSVVMVIVVLYCILHSFGFRSFGSTTPKPHSSKSGPKSFAACWLSTQTAMHLLFCLSFKHAFAQRLTLHQSAKFIRTFMHTSVKEVINQKK